MKINFGRNLKILRQTAKITQEELCIGLNTKFEAKINKSMVSKWENNKELPTINNAACIAEYFDIGIEELIR
jgi:repressor LexA